MLALPEVGRTGAEASPVEVAVAVVVVGAELEVLVEEVVLAVVVVACADDVVELDLVTVVVVAPACVPR